MSNGLTAVFIDVLVLSGSRLARTEQEKRLTIWLAEKDQSKVGVGTVGFDLMDMPWDRGTFEADRSFLRRAIAAAKERLGWGSLDYAPNEELLFPCLEQFDRLLSWMDPAEIRQNILSEWLAAAEASDPVLCGFPTCPRHQTLLTVFGCHVCNNEMG